MEVFDGSVPIPSVQFLYPTSMFTIYAHLQGQNEDKGFVGNTSNIV
jgi:hypothetical protein